MSFWFIYFLEKIVGGGPKLGGGNLTLKIKITCLKGGKLKVQWNRSQQHKNRKIIHNTITTAQKQKNNSQ